MGDWLRFVVLNNSCQINSLNPDSGWTSRIPSMHWPCDLDYARRLTRTKGPRCRSKSYPAQFVSSFYLRRQVNPEPRIDRRQCAAKLSIRNRWHRRAMGVQIQIWFHQHANDGWREWWSGSYHFSPIHLLACTLFITTPCMDSQIIRE